ncbi:MAG: TIGR04255 family protein [Dehalococcoidia bacterium]
MAFPSSPRVVYDNNPLTQVICQLKFPTILEIGSADPADFQKRIRKQYPIYHGPSESSTISSRIPQELSALAARVGLSMGRPGPHRFAIENETRSISLSPEFVAITEDSYTRWDELRPEIALMVEALVKVYEPPFFSRIGLRYQDEIDRKLLGLEDEPWKNLIKPELTGLVGVDFLEDRILESHSNTLCVVQDDKLSAKIRISQGLVAGSEKNKYTIDADLFVDERTEVNDVLPILDQLNRTGGNFFRWVITDKLANALKPQSI